LEILDVVGENKGVVRSSQSVQRVCVMGIFSKLSGVMVGAFMLLLGGVSQAAVISAAAEFDLSSLDVSSTGGITLLGPASHTAFAESPVQTLDRAGDTPVSSIVDDSYPTGSALVIADSADLDPNSVSASATAFDGGFGFGIAGIEIAYEAVDDGDVTVSIEYSAFFDLDGSSIADALVSLILDDDLSGELDSVTLLPGDPDFVSGALSIGFSVFAGEVGSLFLTAAASVDTGVAAVPSPGVPLLIAIGGIGMLGVRARAA
jgi:hypothetical protein